MYLKMRCVNCSNTCLIEHPVNNAVDCLESGHPGCDIVLGARGRRQTACYTEPDCRGVRKTVNTSLNEWNEKQVEQCWLKEKMQGSNRWLEHTQELHTTMRLDCEPRHCLGPAGMAASEGQTKCNQTWTESWNWINAVIAKQEHVVDCLLNRPYT